MNRTQIEHIIRAAGSITGDDELIIIGSQSILGQFSAPPKPMVQSIEVDLYPKNKPDLAALIDGAIGELSTFHQTFGYYAHSVSADTAVLAEGWEGRLIAIENENTRGVTGWCLEVHDLIISKFVAGRKRDADFCRVAIENKLIDLEILLERLKVLELPENVKTKLKAQIERFQ